MYVESIGNIHAMLHKNFSIAFIPKFRDAIFKNILFSPDTNLRLTK